MGTVTSPKTIAAAKKKLQKANVGSAFKIDKREFRETVKFLLAMNDENMSKWLKLVAEGKTVTNPSTGEKTYLVKPDPAKALEILLGMAEFAAPKLARTEHVGDGGGPIEHAHQMRPQLTRDEWLKSHAIEVIDAKLIELPPDLPETPTSLTLEPEKEPISAPIPIIGKIAETHHEITEE